MVRNYTFTSELWEYGGQVSWFFITLPPDISAEIKALSMHTTRGFGSIKVSAKVNASTWATSIFPDSKTSCYLLPLKKSIRSENNLESGMFIDVTLSVDHF